MPRVPESHRGCEWALRTAAEYTGVLVELARAQRGFLFYGETDARRRPLAERQRAMTVVNDCGHSF